MIILHLNMNNSMYVCARARKRYSSYCCRQSGCQCHFQIPLQSHQGRHQDKHLGDLLEHVPVLEKSTNSSAK